MNIFPTLYLDLICRYTKNRKLCLDELVLCSYVDVPACIPCACQLLYVNITQVQVDDVATLIVHISSGVSIH